MFVYVGHGENHLLNKPINLNNDELQKCVYDKLPPIALSFSCLTNQILDTSCYGKIWLTRNNIGGVLHYGATGISFTNLNLDILVLFLIILILIIQHQYQNSYY